MRKFRITPVLNGNCIILPNNDKIIMPDCSSAKDLFDALLHMESRSIRAGEVIAITCIAGTVYVVYKREAIKNWFSRHFKQEEA